MTNLITSNFQAHPFHLVSSSPSSLFTSNSLLILPPKAHPLVGGPLGSKLGTVWYGLHLSSAFVLIRGDDNLLNSNNVEWTLGINYPQFLNNINLNSFYNFISSLSPNNGQVAAINHGVPDYNFNMPGFIGNTLREVSSLEINTGLMGIYNSVNITHVYIVPLALLAPVIIYPLLPLLTKFIDNFFSYSTNLTINLIKNLVKSLPVGFKATNLSGSIFENKYTQTLLDKAKDISKITSTPKINGILGGYEKSFSWIRSKIEVVIPEYLRNIQVYMANCAHSWKDIGSNQPNLINWRCSGCNSGPHIAILECVYCKIKRCRNCTLKR